MTRLLRAFLAQVPLPAAAAEDARLAAPRAWWRAVRRTAKQAGLRLLMSDHTYPELTGSRRSHLDVAKTMTCTVPGPRVTSVIAPPIKNCVMGRD